MKVLTNTLSLAKGALVLGILSSATLGHASSSGLRDLLNQQFASSSQALSSNTCVSELSKNSQALRNIRAEGSVLADMRSNGADLISGSFQQRLKLVEALKKTTLVKGAVSMECEIAFRKYINSRRLFEEYTAISAGLDDSPDVFQGKAPQLLVNPKYGKFELKSGDILVSRGTAVVSAAIAKIGVQRSEEHTSELQSH